MVKFFIEGKPLGKQRPRPNTKTRVVYTPEKTKNYEEKVKIAYLAACNELKKTDKTEKYKWMGKEPLVIRIVAQFEIPKSYTKKRRVAIQQGLEHPVIRPDADNIAKIICDGLNKVAYHDDAQIVDVECIKVYAVGDEEEGVWVYLNEM